MPTESEIRHLLRRTEFVAKPSRVASLLTKPTLAAVVADILTTVADPGTVTFTTGTESEKGSQLVAYWIDRMAYSSRPMQEHMALFWHGHFCSSQKKVVYVAPMRDQIDLYRRLGMSDVPGLLQKLSIQPAMLRYLDNSKNRATSPNENFARELMELFTLGVGNYSEADVQASTLAWSGHSLDTSVPGRMTYLWRGEWHDSSAKQFLGRTINTGTNRTRHAFDTITTIFGNGVVPPSANEVANRGRPTREVAAEFLSRKLWAEFAGTTAPTAVIDAMRATALATNFSVKPWLTTMFLRPEFYSTDVRRGLVRSPVALAVAMLASTRLRGSAISVTHLAAAGQRPLYPPDVSGWKTNRYWIDSGSMAARGAMAAAIAAKAGSGYWHGDGLIHLVGGTISHDEITKTYATRPAALVNRILYLMRVQVSPTTLRALVDYATNVPVTERQHLVKLILTCPDMHLA
ncbi:MAG: DUF1800 family protein [Ilumatobacteraceae bacterium]